MTSFEPALVIASLREAFAAGDREPERMAA
jgi:hypothetical protein